MSSSGGGISDWIDAAPMKGLLLRVPALCAGLMVVEGIDTNIISYVGPLIQKEYGLSSVVLGLIYSATVVASLAGAVLIAPLSDRFGRRPILLGTSFVLSLCSLATPFITTAMGLVALRVVVGLAFGAAVPSTFVLAADYAPHRCRARLIMMVTAGVALGYVLAGFASALVMPHWGWRVLMLMVGCGSLLWTTILFLALPESIDFLLRNRPATAATRNILSALGATSATVAPALAETAPAKARELVSPRLATMTFLLWFIVATVYAVEYLLGYWLPTMLMSAGYSIRDTGLITATGKIASIVGSILIGWLMDRKGLHRMLAGTYFVSTAAFVLLSGALAMPVLMLPAVIATSFFVDGGFSGSQALTITSYPARLRATASGWITGLARLLGGGAGTFCGGLLIQAGFGMRSIALMTGGVMLLGGAAIVILGRKGVGGRFAEVAQPAA